MTLTFKKATKSQSRARIALYGPSGSGKTFTSLALATGLANGGKVAVLDTERGSASKYADVFEFDCIDDLPEFGPLDYCRVIRTAEQAGYAVLVIDSLSHAWSGKGGALEQVDAAAARNPNKFAAWRDVTPAHNELIDTMLTTRMHVVVTMRSKTEYVQEKDERGRTTVRKVGLAPVQRDGMEYEFDICGEMDDSNCLSITKSRCSALARKRIQQPGEELAKTILAWLTDGTPPAATVAQSPRIGIERADRIAQRLSEVGRTVGALRDRVIASNLGHLATGNLDQWDASLLERIEGYITRAGAEKTNGHANGTHRPPAPAPESKPQATEEQAPAPAAAPVPPANAGKKRRLWPVAARMSPAMPAYWHEKLVRSIAAALINPAAPEAVKALNVGVPDAAKIADGLCNLCGVPECPANPEQATTVAADAQAAYRQLIARTDAMDPSLDWTTASIPF